MREMKRTARKLAIGLKSSSIQKDPRIRELRFAMHQIRHSPLTVFGLILIASLVFISIIPSSFLPYPKDLESVNFPSKLQPPSWQHLFGTDDMGRDVFTRVIYGSRISLSMSLIVVAIAMSIGVPLGGVAGYLGGRVDDLIMRLTDIFFAIPSVLLALAIVSALGPSIVNATIAIGVSWWPFYTRLVRGQVLSIREETYVEAARAIGAKDRRIILRHILPNCAPIIIVQSSMQFGYAILMLGTLGFLGLGARPPAPEWGVMIGAGRVYIPDWWWIATFPGLAIFIAVLGFCLVGDGLRDVLDPRLRR